MASSYRHISIDKSLINELPIEVFEGNIHVIETVESAREAVALLQQHGMLGIDTETRPSFRKGQTNKVSLIYVTLTNHRKTCCCNRLSYTT